MLHSPNERYCSRTNPSRAGTECLRIYSAEFTEDVAVLGRRCFVIVLLAAFGQPLLGLANYAAHSSLHSYILLIPVCFWLPDLPSA